MKASHLFGFGCALLLNACTPVCGDNIVAVGEQCDDGNIIGGDGCEANCSLPNTCGNSQIDPGELCYVETQPVSVNGAERLIVLDVQGDNAPDVVTIGRDGGVVLLNDGVGVLTQTSTFLLPFESVNDLIAADVDGDGSPDLITVHSADDSVAVYLNQGNSFGAATVFPAGSTPISVTAADLNIDGQNDLITAPFSEGVELLPNLGNGAFGAPQRISFNQETVGPVALRTSDVNQDTIPEVVALDNLGRLQVIANTNGAIAATAQSVDSQGVINNFIMVDLNGDSFDDVLSSDDTIRSITSNGGALNGISETFSASAFKLASGDFDVNGSNDVVSLSTEDFSSAFILPNVGNGALNVPFRSAINLGIQNIQSARAFDIGVGDFNRDTVPDFVVSFNDGNIDFPNDGLVVVLSIK